ncbi:MAG TPA: nucleotide synthetase [Allosphingosinicella sp.]|jgi:hypothetical protein
MANDGTFKQIKIKETKPEPWNGIRNVPKTLTFDTTDDESALTFFYLQDDGQEDDLSITVIEADCTIIISLDGSKSWSWSTTLDAITTKEDYTLLYGELMYKMPDGSFKKRRSGDKTRYTTIKFVSRLNADIVDHGEHGFSLNIDLIQANAKILPITLDPDIKNPPPDGFVRPKGRKEFLFASE